MIEWIIVLIGGICLGLCIANIAIIFTLKNSVSMGDSKGDFKTFSKYPIRMLSKSQD